MAPSLGWLIAARAVQGAGGAAMMALTLALVSETVPKAGIGRAMGLLGTMSAIGTASGPALGGWLVDGFGWASLFWVNVPLGVLTFAMAWRCLPTQGSVAAAMVTRFDLRGTLVLALTLAAYTLALTPGHGAFDATQAMLFALAVAGLILFMRVESRATSPLVQLSRLRDRALSRGLLASVLVSTVLMATLVVGPFYLARGLALEPSLVGLVLAVGPVVVALSGVPAGRLVDRLGAARLVRIGLASIAAGALGLAFAPSRWGVPGYLAPMVVLTAGYALFQTANNTAVMNGIAASERGVISGLLSLSRNVGLITGTAAMGAVFALATATSDMASATPAAVSTGLRVTFAVAALLMIGTLVMLEWRRDRA
jgi:MFS family permease